MERVCLLIVSLGVLFLFNADGYSYSRATEPPVAEIFSVFEENGKVGLKDEDGEILIPAVYEAIGWSDGKLTIVDRVVGYLSEGRWGLIHTSNRIITPPEFTELVPGEGSLLVARSRSRLSQRLLFGVINTAGKIVIPFDYDGLRLSNMRAVVTMRSGVRYHVGLVDLAHKTLIPLSYRRIYSLGSLRYAVENFEQKTAIFSDDGIQITGFTIDSISAFRKDFAVVYQGQRQGLINRNGEMVIRPKFGEVVINDDGTVRVRDVATWRFLDGENNLAGTCAAEEVRPLSEGRYAVGSAGKFQLTDNSFKAVVPGYFATLGQFIGDRALYSQLGRTGVIHIDGRVIIPADYEALIADGDHFRACLDTGYKNRWVILDTKGNVITGKHYEEISPYNGKFYAVRNRGFWGAVDREGKEIIACVHDSLLERSGDQVAVKFKGQYGIIDIREQWLVTPGKSRVSLLDNERFFLYDDSTTFVKSFEGDIIYFSENPLSYDGKNIRETLPSGARWLIDENGIVINRSLQPEQADTIFRESEGLRAIYKDGKYGFIDDQGRLRIANRYEDARPFSGGIAAIRIRNRWGFIDHQEKLVVQPIYDRIEDFHNGLAIVSQDGAWGLIGTSGKVVVPLRYDEIVPNTHNRYVLRQGKLYGLADEHGTIILHPRYDALVDAGNGYVIVERSGKSGVVTLRGVSTIPMIYDRVLFDKFRGQFMAVNRSDWNTIDNPHLFAGSER